MNLERLRLRLEENGFKRHSVLNKNDKCSVHLWTKNRLIISIKEVTGEVSKVNFSGVCHLASLKTGENGMIEDLFEDYSLSGQSECLVDGTFRFSLHPDVGVGMVVCVADAIINALPLIAGEARVYDAVTEKSVVVRIN